MSDASCCRCALYEVSDGTCRANPPVRLPRKFEPEATAGNRVRDETLIWGWPAVHRHDWCGHWRSLSHPSTVNPSVGGDHPQVMTTKPQPNTTVRIDAKGRMRVFVDGRMISGVTSLKAEGWPDPVVKVEIIGRYVRFEQDSAPAEGPRTAQ
ncbi:hypothetical protein [Bradyrhizobium sp. SEMIA]|uniref:hypothetical protein n=1 Tax=Bradyrhizobium sp. SEMIA TaxID=2597515 RepID=UPI0018A41552|nr:hypothetical protein [Bradyrhizobium sp. SEMIA]QOG20433.1 hypothetical protein FOM02_26870 [Bradyrhizobium sp. SEMIA]